MKPPETHYVRSGSVQIAYQVFGDGPCDLLLMGDWPGVGDAIWEHPGHVRVLRSNAAVSRVIRFDPRGLGASDPVPGEELGDPERWANDALTVLDAVGSERVVVLGELAAAHAAIRVVVSYPERAERLLLINATACGSQKDGYAFGTPQTFVDDTAAWIEECWGTGEVVATIAPTLDLEGKYRDFCARMERLAASRSVAASMVRNTARIDSRPLLDKVALPALVVATDTYPLIAQPEAVRDLAERISGARFLYWPTSSYYFGGDELNEILEFVSGTVNQGAIDRSVLTVLFTDVVDSTRQLAARGDRRWQRQLSDLDDYTRLVIARARGDVINSTGDGHVATFARPTDAIAAAIELQRATSVHGVSLRMGLHLGDVDRRHDGDISGVAVHVAARVAAAAQGGEILVSRTLADVLNGSDYATSTRGPHTLKGLDGEWDLYAVDLAEPSAP